MNKFLKKLSITVALINLLATSKVKAELTTDIKDNSYNNHITSIFDIDNIDSRQYGASQLVFAYHFDELVKDPLIWQELQKYFPLSDFDSEEEAIYFYKKYFEIIYSCGCGYAASCDYVFKLFEGKEDAFYKTFKFPMYTIKNGKIDFNYELFMLKFFNYSIIDTNYSKDVIINSMMKDFYAYQIDLYINSPEYKKKLPDNFHELSSEEREEWMNFDKKREAKFHRLYEKWMNANNSYVNLGIELDSTFGNLSEYLSLYGIDNTKVRIEYNPSTYAIGDIVACKNFRLYKIDENNKIYDGIDNVDAHYVFVTNILDDGKIMVSSWGDQYIFDNSQATWTEKILIKKSQ